MSSPLASLDLAQLRWILQASLRQELRGTRAVSGARRRPRGLISTFLTLGVSGLLAGLAFTGRAEPFAGAFLASSVLMLLVATFVVVEFATIVTGPDDLAFYAPLPVSPATYVAAKLAVVCVFALAAAAAFAMPAIALAAVGGEGIGGLVGLAWSLVSAALTSALAVTAILGFAVRFVPFQRIRSVAFYLQFVIFIGLYGGFALVQRSLRDAMTALSIAFTWPILAAPSAWGAGVLALARDGPAAEPAVLGACLSVAAPVLLATLAWRVVAASYEGRIAEASILTARPASRARRRRSRGLLWRTPEERAIALLIGNQFRHEPQFRFTIMAVVPLTVIYLGIILLVNRVPILDPFTPAGRATFGSTILLYLAIGFFPMYLKGGLVNSTQAEASWILHASPANRLLLLRAARRFIIWCFLAPYLLAVGVLFAFLTRAPLHTIQHFAAVTALVLIETDVLLLFFPELPFSKHLQTGQRGAAIVIRLFAAFILLPPLFLLVLLLYPRPLLAWIGLAGLFACLAAVRIAGSRFAARRLELQEMSG